MGVGQLSESDAVDALRLPFYSSRHARGSHVPGNQFDLGNTSEVQAYIRTDVQKYRSTDIQTRTADYSRVASRNGM